MYTISVRLIEVKSGKIIYSTMLIANADRRSFDRLGPGNSQENCPEHCSRPGFSTCNTARTPNGILKVESNRMAHRCYWMIPLKAVRHIKTKK